MQVLVKKWGNCPAVRLPAAVMKAANLALDQAVEVSQSNGVITLRPVIKKRRYTREELLANTPRESAVPGWDALPAAGSELL